MNQMSVPLTVALLTYNRAHYLRESLPAIINQTYRDFELLVLDNGSTDDTPNVVLSFRDDRLRYIRNAPGFNAAFNNLSAIWIARGERLLITHDDDIMEPDMLKRQMEFIGAHPETTAIWTNSAIIDEYGNLLQKYISPPGKNRFFEHGEYIARIAEENLWLPPSSLIFMPHILRNEKLHQRYCGKPVSKGSGDLTLPALMNLYGPVAFINAPLFRYRQHTIKESHQGHLANSALHIAKMLGKFVRRTKFGSEFSPIFNARANRFKAQNLVMNVERASINGTTQRKLTELLRKGASELEASPRSGHPLLPLIVLLTHTGAAEAGYEVLEKMAAPIENSQTWVRQLYRWARHRQIGGNIFASLAPGSRIAIVGSVLVSGALIHEARQAGMQVACCLDSSFTRQGRTFLGIPIFPHSWLATQDSPPDLIVLSSERDHEQELEKMIRRHDPDTPITSWKNLVNQAIDHDVS